MPFFSNIALLSPMEFILGSQSPRRKEVLSFFDIPFKQVVPDYDEEAVPFEDNPVEYVQILALGKANTLVSTYPNSLILTADTIVYKQGRIFGKPKNAQEAIENLKTLSGDWHSVFTGLAFASQGHLYKEWEETRVLFNILTDEQVKTYYQMLSLSDKAGGYMIQGSGGLIVKRIEGCYYNVMGLPLNGLCKILKKGGIDLWKHFKRCSGACLTAALLLISPYCNAAQTDENFPYQQGHILFLLEHGALERALKLYDEKFQSCGKHDFDLLHKIGLKILDYGCSKSDPVCQLLALFGASVSAHDDAYYILEESLNNPNPGIQLVALHALAHFQHDRADQAIIRALGKPTLEVRYEAVHQLCKKKHPQAVSQAESLMYKTPSSYLHIYPALFAMVGDPYSTRILRKLLNQSSHDVRLAVILSIAKYQRDDLLPQIRQQSMQLQFALQEACASAFGELKDEESIPKLEKLTQSQYPTVALAANLALLKMGRHNAIKAIEKAALNEDLFAIAALCSIPDHPQSLLELIDNPNLQIRLNALISLMEQHHTKAFDLIGEVIIRDNRDLAFTEYQSPGRTLKAWKVTPSASQLLKDDIKAYQEHLELKESLLETLSEISPPHFFALANQIFVKQQNDLVPHTVELLENLGNEEAITCLKKHQQQFGAPLIRQYCNLALYRLREPGPYALQLRQWVKNQCKTELIRFKPFCPWQFNRNCHTLTPEETSQLLIKAFETFASQQDAPGVETLIEAIATGHEKNKYALAGLLLRASQ